MKKLIVPYIEQTGNTFPFFEFSEPQAIDILPWAHVGEKPVVHFAIAHDGAHIYLRYTVQEHSVIAKTTQKNGPVWQDSCVEFFVIPENDGVYYNFEMNCIGAILLYAGKTRQERTPATDAVIDKIVIESSLGSKPFEEQTGYFDWTLTAVIPISCFFQHDVITLKGKTCRANFYKCGDGLSQPHYLAWNNIETATPDFHTSQYFGEIMFE